MKRSLLIIPVSLIGVSCMAQQNGDSTNTNKAQISVSVTKDGKTESETTVVDMSSLDELDKMFRHLDTIIDKSIKAISNEIFITVDDNTTESDHEDEVIRAEQNRIRATHPRLGVYLRMYRNYDNDAVAGEGALVMRVVPGSPAEAAGLMEGDVITAINGHPVRGAVSAHEEIMNAPADHPVEIVYYRDDNRQLTEVNFPKQKDEDGVHSDPIIHPSLGITGRSATDGGVLVFHSLPHSTAWELGLRQGDRITQLNGEPVEDIYDLRRRVRQMHAGEEIQIVFERHGFSHSAAALLRNFDDMVNGITDDETTQRKEVHINISIEKLPPEETALLQEWTGVEVKPKDDLEYRSISFTPNPVQDRFTLTFIPAAQDEAQLQLFDLNGKILVNEPIPAGSERFTKEIDLSQSVSGVYILLITQNGHQLCRKIVKK